MWFLILAAVLLPVSLANSCGAATNCFDCNSVLDSFGVKSCSWCVGSSHCVPAIGLECVFGSKITNKDDCPVAIPKRYEYNETLAKKMMWLSEAAYGTNPQFCLKKGGFSDVTVTNQFIVHCDNTKEDTCSGYTSVSHQEGVIIATFRGTMGDQQLWQEAENILFKKKKQLVGGGSVSEYFNDAFYAVWNGGMLAEVQQLKLKYPTYDIWVTGHSMGAALAAVGAHVIAATKLYPGEKMKLVTFGQPRVGDRDFTVAHDNLLPYKYRVTHKRDMVVHAPPENLLGFRHPRYEVWYDNDMKPGDAPIICLSPEDNKCSDQHLFVDLTWDDHTHYFGFYVHDVIDNGGCLP